MKMLADDWRQDRKRLTIKIVDGRRKEQGPRNPPSKALVGVHSLWFPTGSLCPQSRVILTRCREPFATLRVRSFSVSSVVGRASTQRSLRGSVCSVLKLEMHGGRREPRFGCGHQPRCASVVNAISLHLHVRAAGARSRPEPSRSSRLRPEQRPRATDAPQSARQLACLPGNSLPEQRLRASLSGYTSWCN